MISVEQMKMVLSAAYSWQELDEMSFCDLCAEYESFLEYMETREADFAIDEMKEGVR